MADLVIRGMNMPKSCDECRLFNESWCMALSVENWRKSYNKPPEGGRLPDCPLLPIPEGHGRLIDADAFRADYGLGKDCENCDRNTRNCNYDICLSRMDVCGWIDDAPTIVPAEGGSDNGNC